MGCLSNAAMSSMMLTFFNVINATFIHPDSSFRVDDAQALGNLGYESLAEYS